MNSKIISIRAISLIMGSILSLSAIFGGVYTGVISVDKRYAKAAEFCELRSEFDIKKLQDEIFQLKLLIVQENIYAGGQDTQSTVWMEQQLKIKELRLKSLIEKGGTN